jgi:SAM-dependent methyltransferase
MQVSLWNSPGHVRHLFASDIAGPRFFREALLSVPPDAREGWWDLVMDGGTLAGDAIPEDGLDLPRGCTPYLPCPVQTALGAIEALQLGQDDVFVDVGSGIGRVTALAHFLTGVAAIGVEIQKQLVERADRIFKKLNRSRLVNVRGDAAELIRFLPTGTAYFLYCPCDGRRLDRIFMELEEIARTKKIRVCCVDMPPLQLDWLRPRPALDDSWTIYQSAPVHPSGSTPRH